MWADWKPFISSLSTHFIFNWKPNPIWILNVFCPMCLIFLYFPSKLNIWCLIIVSAVVEKPRKSSFFTGFSSRAGPGNSPSPPPRSTALNKTLSWRKRASHNPGLKVFIFSWDPAPDRWWLHGNISTKQHWASRHGPFSSFSCDNIWIPL